MAAIKVTGNHFKDDDDSNNNICQGLPDNCTLPNNASCTQFFICQDERPIPNTCPPGQWFNAETSACDSSENDECDPDGEFKCPEDGVYMFPDGDYCDRYIMCFAGFPIPTRCADGLYFDRELLTCNFPEFAECKLEVCPRENDPKNVTFIASDVECDKYTNYTL